MKYFVTLLFIAFLCQNFTEAQNLPSSAQIFKLGFDFGINRVNTLNIQSNETNGLPVEGLPLSLHLIGDYKINDILLLRGKIGGVPLWVEFKGLEAGIDLNYFLYKPIYLGTGFLIHFNQGGNGSLSWASHYVTIPMLKLGAGVELKVFEIFVEYFVPLLDRRIYSSLDPITYEARIYNFKNMFRIGFTFSWGL